MICLKRGKTLEHHGLKLEILGIIGCISQQALITSSETTFLHVTRTLESSGSLSDGKTIPFQFTDVDKSYESYYGSNLRVKYLLRLTIEKNLSSSIVKEVEIFVVRFSKEPAVNCFVKIECGYEDAVQTELELAQLKHHNNDVLLGRVYFHIIRVRLEEVTLKVIRKEIIGVGRDATVYDDVIGHFVILDGPVAKGDSIPIRVFLKSCGVTPTYTNISNRASVKYFIFLLMRDEEGRTFSKEQEIVIWRPDEKIVREGIISYKSK
jgi:vacuolar protein sorting-associated protein 26